MQIEIYEVEVSQNDTDYFSSSLPCPAVVSCPVAYLYLLKPL